MRHHDFTSRSLHPNVLHSETGRRQIERVVRATPNGLKKALDGIQVKIRRAAREVQEFLPESSYRSLHAAMQVHLASTQNYVCRFHGARRGYIAFDNVSSFVGVGHPKVLSTPKKRDVKLEPGHMNCGCSIEDVLLEFFFWKTFIVMSSNPQIQTQFRVLDHNIIYPDMRRIWVQHWKQSTALTVEDIYDTVILGVVFFLRNFSMVSKDRNRPTNDKLKDRRKRGHCYYLYLSRSMLCN